MAPEMPVKEAKGVTTPGFLLKGVENPEDNLTRLRRGRLLCIDDDARVLESRRALLERAGYSVSTAADPVDGFRLYLSGTFDAVILDYRMPLMNGGVLAACMRHLGRGSRLILISASADIPEGEAACFDHILPKGASGTMLDVLSELLKTP